MTASLHVIHTTLPERWDLKRASTIALEQHWFGRRKEANCRSWCRMLQQDMGNADLSSITTADIQAHILRLRTIGLQPWTVHARVCIISTLYTVAKRNGYTGPVPTIPRPHVPKPLKWWLTPEKEVEVIQWLSEEEHHEMADFVAWTVQTGLRVEESLRVTLGSFHGLSSGTPELLVPGSKTESAQASTAVSAGAAQIAYTRFTASCSLTEVSAATPLFTMSYPKLDRHWQSVRAHFGWTKDTTATLKALRRSFARRVFANGAPLPVVQGMMRHKDPQTTMNYLRLVGGQFTTEEQRKWL